MMFKDYSIRGITNVLMNHAEEIYNEMPVELYDLLPLHPAYLFSDKYFSDRLGTQNRAFLDKWAQHFCSIYAKEYPNMEKRVENLEAIFLTQLSTVLVQMKLVKLDKEMNLADKLTESFSWVSNSVAFYYRMCDFSEDLKGIFQEEDALLPEYYYAVIKEVDRFMENVPEVVNTYPPLVYQIFLYAILIAIENEIADCFGKIEICGDDMEASVVKKSDDTEPDGISDKVINLVLKMIEDQQDLIINGLSELAIATTPMIRELMNPAFAEYWVLSKTDQLTIKTIHDTIFETLVATKTISSEVGNSTEFAFMIMEAVRTLITRTNKSKLREKWNGVAVAFKDDRFMHILSSIHFFANKRKDDVVEVIGRSGIATMTGSLSDLNDHPSVEAANSVLLEMILTDILDGVDEWKFLHFKECSPEDKQFILFLIGIGMKGFVVSNFIPAALDGLRKEDCPAFINEANAELIKRIREQYRKNPEDQ